MTIEEQTPMYNGAAKASAKPAIAWRTLAEQVPTLGDQGDPFPTGFRTLDALCRGGFRLRRVVVLAGAPGAGKTMLAVQLAVALVGRGVHVGILAADEAATGLLIRIGQQLGEEREALERGGAETLARFTASCERLGTLLLADADETGARVEDISAELRRRANGAPSALIIDSMQRARADGTDAAQSPRQRIDCVVLAMRNAAKSDGHLVLATSEVARAFYRGGDPSQEPDPLAAAKESGSVEYASDVLLVMKSIPGGDGDVDVAIPKNRTGRKGEFRLRPDFARARLAEIDRPAAPTTEQKEIAKAAKERAAVDRIKVELAKAVVRTRSPLTSREQVLGLVTGGNTEKNRALTELMDEGAIVRRPLDGDNRRHAFRVASAADLAPESESLRDRSVERSGAVGAASSGKDTANRSAVNGTAPEHHSGAPHEIDGRSELSPAPSPVGGAVEYGAVDLSSTGVAETANRSAVATNRQAEPSDGSGSDGALRGAHRPCARPSTEPPLELGDQDPEGSSAPSDASPGSEDGHPQGAQVKVGATVHPPPDYEARGLPGCCGVIREVDDASQRARVSFRLPRRGTAAPSDKLVWLPFAEIHPLEAVS